jgi:hypothetical protein
MSKYTRIIRNTTRQLVCLVVVIGLTFAAGIDWAEAAETGARASGTMPGELHVILLFALMLGMLAHLVAKPQQRARVRGRPEKRRPARR